jgi:hypothetical protein
MHISDYDLLPDTAYQCKARLEAGTGYDFTFGIDVLTDREGVARANQSSIPLPSNVSVRDLDLLLVRESASQLGIEPSRQGDTRRPVGLVNLSTGLILPVDLGGWGLSGPWEVFDEVALGSAASFQHESGRLATLYVYDLGLESIPDGADSVLVGDHIRVTEDEIDGVTADLVSEPSHRRVTLGKGGERVEWLACSFLAEDIHSMSVDRYWVFLTGWENHFVKVRVVDQAVPTSSDEIDSALGGFMDDLSLDIATC